MQSLELGLSSFERNVNSFWDFCVLYGQVYDRQGELVISWCVRRSLKFSISIFGEKLSENSLVSAFTPLIFFIFVLSPLLSSFTDHFACQVLTNSSSSRFLRWQLPMQVDCVKDLIS